MKNYGCQIKKRVVPNRSAKNCPLQRALRNEGFRRVQLMDTSALMILCADSLHDDGATIWAWDDNAEGHFKKRLFDPLHQGYPVPGNLPSCKVQLQL